MRKCVFIVVTALFFLVSLSSNAQVQENASGQEEALAGEIQISGIVGEEDSSQSISQAAVQLLSPADSTMIDGVVTDSFGRFSLKASPGQYILKISCLSYVTVYRTLSFSAGKSDVNLGLINLVSDSIWLNGAVVAAAAQPITVIADTVVYNAAAYKVADDAMLEDLLRKIPGLEIDGNGNVKLQGKDVKQLLVNGKRFFGGDVKTGLKNLTADMVENIRAYERESDFARLSGVDDGEEEPVIDITIKKSMMGGTHNNINTGGGTSKKYALKASSNRISKKEQLSVIANMNNLSSRLSMNNTSRNQLGSGSRGDCHDRDAGMNFSRDLKKLQIEGHAQYSGNNRDATAHNRSQNVLAASTSYSNSLSHAESFNNTFKGDLTLEWRPNSTWTLRVKPIFSYKEDVTDSHSQGASFNSDPYSVSDNPFDYLDLGVIATEDPLRAQRVNTSLNHSLQNNKRLDATVSVTASARNVLKKGRSFTYRLQGQINSNPNVQTSDYLTRYFRYKANPDSALIRRHFIDNNNAFYGVTNMISWSEPIIRNKGLYFQTTYTFETRRYNMTRDVFKWTGDFDDKVLDRQNDLCSLGNYTYFNHQLQASIRYIFKKLNMYLGATWRPHQFVLRYPGDGGDVVIKGSKTFLTPNINIKYKKSKSTQFSLLYRGWSNIPSLYNLLPVVNATNPTHLHYGNPSLEPAFTHNMRLDFNSSNIIKQNSIVFNLSGSVVENMQSNSTVYDPESGIRTVTPKNIGGNWNVNGNTTLNQVLPDNRFSLSNHTSASYQNSNAYLYNSKKKVDEMNEVHRFMVKELLDITFRNDWFELLLNAGGEYTSESSLLRPAMNQTPYALRTGASTSISAPWKMRFEADATFFAQRGYSYDELNRNYYIINASLAQTILKKKGTIRLEWNDILRSQENVVRSFTSERRSVAMYNGANSYVMLRFMYRFKL